MPMQKMQKYRGGQPNVAYIQTVSSMMGELFYLCCLLMHRSAHHYKDLYMFQDQSFETYHKAAIHLGLFTSHDEGFYAMEEAVTFYLPPSRLHFLFSHIIIKGYPAQLLWDTYDDDLSLDIVHSLHSTEQGIDHILQQIGEFIKEGG